MGVIFEALIRATMSDSLQKGEGLGLGLDTPRDLRGRLLQAAAASRGEAAQVKAALAAEIRKAVLQKSEPRLRVGAKVKHIGTGMEGVLGRLGNGYGEIWCSGGGVSRWPIDEISAIGEESPVTMPGGVQGGYPGEPAVGQAKAAAFLSSAEGQALLAKTIRRTNAPTRMGFQKSARREFKPGTPLIHPATGKRGKFIMSQSGHGILQDEETGRLSAFPLEELAETLEPGFSTSSESPYEDPHRGGYSSVPNVKVERYPNGSLKSIALV